MKRQCTRGVAVDKCQPADPGDALHINIPIF